MVRVIRGPIEHSFTPTVADAGGVAAAPEMQVWLSGRMQSLRQDACPWFIMAYPKVATCPNQRPPLLSTSQRRRRDGTVPDRKRSPERRSVVVHQDNGHPSEDTERHPCVRGPASYTRAAWGLRKTPPPTRTVAGVMKPQASTLLRFLASHEGGPHLDRRDRGGTWAAPPPPVLSTPILP